MKASRLIVVCTILVTLLLVGPIPNSSGGSDANQAAQIKDEVAIIETSNTNGSTTTHISVASASGSSNRLPSSTDSVHSSLRNVPLMFIENVGQFDPDVRFQVRDVGGSTLWLTNDALWITILEQPESEEQLQGFNHSLPSDLDNQSPTLTISQGVHLRFAFVGANPAPHIEPLNRLDTVISYFTGADPGQWQADVPVWGGVRYRDLYPGIDLELGSEQGRLAPRLVAHPDSDLNAVQLRVEGSNEVVVEGQYLHLTTDAGSFYASLLQVEGIDTSPWVFFHIPPKRYIPELLD